LAYAQAFMSGDFTGNIYGGAPDLAPLGANGGTMPTHAPYGTSPVIDKGKSFGYTVDQLGFARSIDVQSVGNAFDGTDMGAVEFGSNDTVAPTLQSFANNVSGRLYVGATVTYTLTFSENIYQVGANDFVNAGTAGVTIGNPTVNGSVVTLPVVVNSAGTLQLRIPGGAVISDNVGNPLAVPLTDSASFNAYLRPSINSIANDVNGGPVNFGAVVTYTLTFSTNVTGVDASDFDNAGSALVIIGTPTTASNVVTLPVTTTSTGTLRLRIPTAATIADTASSALATPVLDSTTITVNSANVAQWVVDTTSSDATLNTCSNAPNDCSLAGALGKANASPSDDLIIFDAAVFNVARTILTNSNALLIDNQTRGRTTLSGPGAKLLTIDAAHTSRVFLINPGSEAIISGLTLTNGGSYNGGDCNRYAPGGGIYSSGNVMIYGCSITNNFGARGAGIYVNGSGSSLTVVNSSIANNTGGNGVGIHNAGGTTRVLHSTVTGNVSNLRSFGVCSPTQNVRGAGIYNEGGTLNLEAATIANNIGGETT
ncbi:MAG TPA: right-handed parallel beta-helix repeat-containing protein, partial [Chthoniobacterales bacterium]